MKLLIYGLNFFPEKTGVGKYSGELAQFLSRKGHEVHVICAPPYYPEWKIGRGYSPCIYTSENLGELKVFRAPLYVPVKVSLIKRLFHLASFAVSSFPLAVWKASWRPDVVLVIQPTLFVVFNALLLARISGAKVFMHVQDYEVDAMFGAGLSRNQPLYAILSTIEGWLMKVLDGVSTISAGMLDRALSKGVSSDKLVYFPNWSDTEFVTPYVSGSVLKKEWGFSEDKKIVLYSGNIGEKQGLGLLLEVAKRFQKEADIQYVIVGAGAGEGALKERANEMQLSNLCFFPPQPWDKVPEMLAMADIHLVLQKRSVADAVMPSKLVNILSAGGHALVTADVDTELGDIAVNHPGVYRLVEPENADALEAALRGMFEMDLTKPNRIARKYAVEYFSANKVLSHFERDLTDLVSNAQA